MNPFPSRSGSAPRCRRARDGAILASRWLDVAANHQVWSVALSPRRGVPRSCREFLVALSSMTAVARQPRAALMDRLVNVSGAIRSEATIQADVRMLLLDPHLGLSEESLDVQLETPVGDRKRIDVEVGCTVIEVKRSLATPAAIASATTQLGGYVVTRAAELGQRYVGILTDGRLWIAFHEVDGGLVEATRITATGGEAGAVLLLGWLEGVLATRRAVAPTPQNIADQLGAQSSAHALDYSTLAALYDDGRDLPTVQLKRELWAKLLRGALGTQFIDSDELFLDHTLLVNSAEIIAHLVLGLPAEQLTPATLLSGDQFAMARIYGVVDRDFFDWVLEVPGGEGYVAALARQLSRFDWSAVQHDVLKVLYESVIPAETRKALGEYYTPDWLANRIVSEVITDPLRQRAVDVSCGSGTFTFYAVKRFLAAADTARMGAAEALAQVSSHVIGIDLHPVAVALARVTYLLAIGRDRLSAPRDALSVPIYLGDSLGWDQRDDLLTVDYVVIPTESDEKLLTGELRFPDHLLADAKNFDELVQALIEESERAVGKATKQLSAGTVRRLNIAEADLPVLAANFARLKELHEEGRNHIWAYYIRNVTRPAWLSREDNRADVLMGNPPWLSYRFMTEAMQKRFKSFAVERNLWSDETTATHQDLAGVFVARAVERYLKTGGKLAFVVPNPVLDRDYWAGFRRGEFDGANVAFDVSWDLRRIRPHLFPRGSGVIFGRRELTSREMPRTALIWTGRAPERHSHSETAALLTQSVGELTLVTGDDPTSPYAQKFSQGATLAPRVLWRVEETAAGLGVPTGLVKVQSKRSATEKKPWKDFEALTGVVESEFVWPALLGEQVIPFHVRAPEMFVVPLTQGGRLLTGEDSKIDAYPGLAAWVRTAEEMWETHKRSKMTLSERLDHMRGLTNQVPVTQTRVLYSKAGMHLAAAVLVDHRPIIDTTLYWATMGSESEAHYLAGILNAPITTELAQPLMSYGKDERHIDKSVWKLPIPLFDPADEIHTEIAALARGLAATVADVPFPSDNFVTIRRAVRSHILKSANGQKLDRLVAELLGTPRIEVPSTDLDSADAPVAELSDDVRLIRIADGMAPSADIEIDFDCEYDAAGTVYLWGALRSTPDGQSTYHSFGEPSPDVDEHALAYEFLQWCIQQQAQSNGAPVRFFHYGRADAHQLDRILSSAAQPVLTAALDVLGEVIRPSFYAPQGYSLKKLAPAAGAVWRDPAADGAAALAWIDAARTGGDTWDTLLRYNEDDVRALRALRGAVREAATIGAVLRARSAATDEERTQAPDE